jgi:hypothetical protein
MKKFSPMQFPAGNHPFNIRRALHGICLVTDGKTEQVTVERMAQELELPESVIMLQYAKAAGETPIFATVPFSGDPNYVALAIYFTQFKSAKAFAGKLNERLEYNLNKLQVGKTYKFCAEDLAAAIVGDEFGEGTCGDYPCDDEKLCMYIEGYKGQYRLYNNADGVDLASEYTKKATVKAIDTKADTVDVEFSENHIAKLSSFEARACLEPLEG